MNPRSERVKRWRHRTKQRLIDAFGGKCGICGYSKCPDVFEFHHLDPAGKDFHWGQINGWIRGWSHIVLELKKCVMLCANCHREVHSKRSPTEIPNDILRFDPSFECYNPAIMDQCVICGTLKKVNKQFCSGPCSKKARQKVDWDKIDICALLIEHKSYEGVGRILGVSGNAVRRRVK